MKQCVSDGEIHILMFLEVGGSEWCGMGNSQLDHNILKLDDSSKPYSYKTFWREGLVQYDKKWECPDHDRGVPGSLCPLLYKAPVKDRNMDSHVQD